jgi:hypothetical protein
VNGKNNFDNYDIVNVLNSDKNYVSFTYVLKINVEIDVPTAWGGTESQAIRYSKGGSALPPPPT